MIRSHVLICGGTGCTSSGSKLIQETFEKEIVAQGLENEVKIVQTGCFGHIKAAILFKSSSDFFYNE